MFLKICHPSLNVRILFLVLGFILFAGISAGCSLSFAADVTPPPAVQMGQVNLTSSSTPVVSKFPILLPNIKNGESIYQAKCASCHGVNGLGGGSQSSDLPNSVSAIGNLEFASQKEPVAWFEIVSEGNLDRSMPGYKSLLSDRQRWDVVAYLYTLAYKPDSQVAAGQIYQTECQVCHGDGSGNGNLAVQLGLEMPDWLDPSRLVEFSANDLKAIIEGGSENGMPAFGEQLTAEQIQSLAGYIQTYGFTRLDAGDAAALSTPPAEESSPAGTGAAVPTPEPAASSEDKAQSSFISIYGNVSNGSGGARPEGGVVTLQGFTGMEQAFTITTDLQMDGSFRFEEVDLVSNPVLLASVEYAGMTFFSEFLPVLNAHGGDEVELPILVYDSTQDLSMLNADRVHIFFNFPQADRLQVVELFVISNSGNLAVIPQGPGKPVLEFTLPEGAENLQFEDGELGQRYIKTETGFGDMAAIIPGNTSHQLLFAYEIPYSRKKNFELQFPLDVQSALVALPAGPVRLQSGQLVDTGTRDINGTQVQMFTAKDISKDDSLALAISGKPLVENPSAASNSANIAIGLAALGLSLIAAGIWYTRTHPKARLEEIEDDQEGEDSALPDNVESLLDEIVALDDIYKEGQLSEEVYIERRADLKKRLAVLRNQASGG